MGNIFRKNLIRKALLTGNELFVFESGFPSPDVEFALIRNLQLACVCPFHRTELSPLVLQWPLWMSMAGINSKAKCQLMEPLLMIEPPPALPS